LNKFISLIWLILIVSSCQSGLSKKEIERYRQEGNDIVKSTGEKLSSTLMSKIEEGGISEAVDFCSQSALSITQKMSTHHGVEIKRTSLQTRNPENRPGEYEISVLNDFEDKLLQGESLVPVVTLGNDGKPHYYAPILAQKKCLMCHGQLNKDLSSAVDSIIKSRYPEDLATGYSEGDLRGMWSVTFDLPKP
jgi:hypothetical protein